MNISGGKFWFSAAELADLTLPGLPKAKSKVILRANSEGWALKVDSDGKSLSRRRGGRGGGQEYHFDVLPAAARAEIVKRGIAVSADISATLPAAVIAPASLWPWFDAQSEKTKAEARRRVGVISAVDAHERAGQTRSAAVALAGADHGVAASTLWKWLQAVAGIDPNDRLPHLAPRRAAGGAEAEIDEAAWSFLISDYCRPEKPTFSSCYYRMVREYAQPRGLSVPAERSLRRRLERIDRRVIVSRREGADALRRTIPHQQRTVAQLHAMELVNIDGHRWDVFVRWPDGRIARPMMVAIQDIFSRKFLAWRVGETEDAVLTRLAFADLFANYGIPRGCLLDNGRAFASKWITGGAKTRFRFKIRDDEPLGVLTQLGITTHWATPHHGQAKPIERGFRDFCDHVAKRPEFSGAYTGNRPDAKPENYQSAAVDLADFIRVVTAGIAAHNAKPGRRTETARMMPTGEQSFDQVFAKSYAAAPIGKATAEQMRLALLTADDRSTDRNSGAIELAGNRYWSPELAQIAGQRVTVRFDPDDLTTEIHVYRRTGEFLCSAPIVEATGFLDMGAAKSHARKIADWRKATKRAAEAEGLLLASQLVAQMPAIADEPEVPEPRVVRPVRSRGHTAAALKPRADFDTHFDALDRLGSVIPTLSIVK